MVGATQCHLQCILKGTNNRSGRFDFGAASSNWKSSLRSTKTIIKLVVMK